RVLSEMDSGRRTGTTPPTARVPAASSAPLGSLAGRMWQDVAGCGSTRARWDAVGRAVGHSSTLQHPPAPSTTLHPSPAAARSAESRRGYGGQPLAGDER